MKKILSIDDEPSILDCIRETLEQAGYAVVTTTDPQHGLRLLRQDRQISLVLLDVKMPEMSGFDIYREYRRERKLPALFVTAYPASFNARSDEIVRIWQTEFADGTTDIVYKPFDIRNLIEKVESLIGHPEH